MTMADISAAAPIILPDTSAGAEPRSYWSTVGERLLRDRVTLAVGGVLLCDHPAGDLCAVGRDRTTRCRAACCAG